MLEAGPLFFSGPAGSITRDKLHNGALWPDPLVDGETSLTYRSFIYVNGNVAVYVPPVGYSIGVLALYIEVHNS